MVAIDAHMHPGPLLGVVGAFGLLLGILVSGNYQDNPVMIVTMVLYWSLLGWLFYRVVRILTQVFKLAAKDRDV